MALSPLASSDVGAAARDKINAGLAAIDANNGARVQREQELADAILAQATARADADNSLSRAIQQETELRDSGDDSLSNAIQEEARARADADAAEARIRTKADDEERDARLAGDADSVTASLAAILCALQPGIAPGAFSNAALGGIADLPPIDPSGVFTGPLGPAWRIRGAGLIAPRGAVLIDPEAISVVQARYWRVSDVLDPNNNAVDLGLQWLDQTGADAGTSLLQRETNLRVQDGPRKLTFRVPSLRGSRAPVIPPPGAVSWRPFLRTYGEDGATAVSLLGVRDVTFAGAYVPDVADLAARIGTIEGQLAAGLPLSAPILPSYAVTDLPKPGSRGRKAFALDGRAPNAAGTLEAANTGTGVEVTDNGAAWVITGTNQQVQA